MLKHLKHELKRRSDKIFILQMSFQNSSEVSEKKRSPCFFTLTPLSHRLLRHWKWVDGSDPRILHCFGFSPSDLFSSWASRLAMPIAGRENRLEAERGWGWGQWAGVAELISWRSWRRVQEPDESYLDLPTVQIFCLFIHKTCPLWQIFCIIGRSAGRMRLTFHIMS